jgi:hypothetical protein
LLSDSVSGTVSADGLPAPTGQPETSSDIPPAPEAGLRVKTDAERLAAYKLRSAGDFNDFLLCFAKAVDGPLPATLSLLAGLCPEKAAAAPDIITTFKLCGRYLLVTDEA